ncbi:MAG TPA: GWxTD domain-containing protein [Blastocatellia bacterium]|nr:GWxTD domain-containing protein [Blastocatellia bacterium]
MKSEVCLFRRNVGVALMLLLIAGVIPSSMAQEKSQSKEKPAKDRNASKKKEELKSVYKNWMDEDVLYIITDEERRAFKALKTDEERDQFIENFWLRRDPDPDTPENEYKEEYHQRIQYANEKFASGVPGWRTDRGRIYIMFGKPDELETHPTGGAYERPSWEGGGSTTTYPFETWWYRYIEGIGSDIEIEFVDPSGTGEYRIARSPDEKDALLHVPGAGLTLAESLGMANKADRVAGLGGNLPGNGMYGGGRAKDQPFEKLQLLADLQRAPAVKFPDLRVRADLPEIASDILPFSVRTDFFRLSGESVVTSFTVQFDHADLSFKNQGGVYSAQANIYAKLTSLSGRRAGSFEDVLMTGRYGEDQLAAAQTQKSIYQKNVVLPPGRYKIDVVARDIVSGKTGVLHHSFEVPRYQEKQFATSTLILASSIETLDNRAIPAGQFIIGRFKVRPMVSGIYRPQENLALFLQVYDADMDQATLQPALRVEYVITKGGQEVARVVEDGKTRMGLIDVKGQQLVVARAIPLQGKLAEPGEYVVTARITDLVSQKVVTPQARYSVVAK